MAEEFATKDSGTRAEYETGARRDTNVGKGRYDLLPWFMLKRDAELYERGAAKYGDWNWQQGIPLTRYIDSTARHTAQLIAGDRSEDHAAAIRFNVAGFEWTREEILAGRLPASLAKGVPAVQDALKKADPAAPLPVLSPAPKWCGEPAEVPEGPVVRATRKQIKAAERYMPGRTLSLGQLHSFFWVDGRPKPSYYVEQGLPIGEGAFLSPSAWAQFCDNPGKKEGV